jgi:hypothetical protein
LLGTGNRARSLVQFKTVLFIKIGFECHADYNASINIRDDFLKLRVLVPGTCVPAKKHLAVGASVNAPIVSTDNFG